MTNFNRTISAQKPSRGNRFLLLVDNNSYNVYYLSIVLQRLGYQISTAANAREALAISAVATPSLIITTLKLPDMSGLDFIHQARQNPDIASVPVIAMREQDDLPGEKRCRELPAVDCVTLPVNIDRLFRAIQAALEATPRTTIRIKTLLPVKVNNLPLNGLGGASAAILSERGIFLPTTRPAPIDTRLILQLQLNNHLVTVEAVVLYSNHAIGNSSEELGMGLEFYRITPADRELVRQFIMDEITRGIEYLRD